jgi:hypothetical protein
MFPFPAPILVASAKEQHKDDVTQRFCGGAYLLARLY